MIKSGLRKMRFVAALMSLAILAGVLPLCAAADAGSECLLLRAENIALPQNEDGSMAAGWSLSPYPAGSYYGLLSDESGKYLGVINTNVGQAGFNASTYASASIYVEGDKAAADQARDYYVWIAGRNEAARACHIAFDESESFTSLSPISSGHATMAWSTAQANSFRLSAGIHTLKIKVGVGNSSNMQAVIITDDAGFSPVGKSYAELAELAIVDITPPTVINEDAFSYEYASDGTGTFTFPEVSDDSTVRYICKIGERTEISVSENPSVVVEGIKPLEELTVEWYATDCVNTVARSWTVVASPVATEGFALAKLVQSDETEVIPDLSSLSAKDTVVLETALTNRLAEEKNLKLILILYTNHYERMAAESETEISLAGGETNKPVRAELTLPEDFDASSAIISAVLWENEGQEPYITGIELRGSAA